MKNRGKGFEKKNVLMIVEDFDFIRNLIGRYFQVDGYDVISAGNIHEAIAIGEHEQPKIVIVDFEMRTNEPYLIVSILDNMLPLSQIVLVNGRHKRCNQEDAMVAGADKILERIFDPLAFEELEIEAARMEEA